MAADLFPQARRSGDRFHVQKQVNAALNQMRIAAQRGQQPSGRNYKTGGGGCYTTASTWIRTNGVVEGGNNKIKLIKRRAVRRVTRGSITLTWSQD